MEIRELTKRNTEPVADLYSIMRDMLSRPALAGAPVNASGTVVRFGPAVKA